MEEQGGRTHVLSHTLARTAARRTEKGGIRPTSTVGYRGKASRRTPTMDSLVGY